MPSRWTSGPSSRFAPHPGGSTLADSQEEAWIFIQAINVPVGFKDSGVTIAQPASGSMASKPENCRKSLSEV